MWVYAFPRLLCFRNFHITRRISYSRYFFSLRILIILIRIYRFDGGKKLESWFIFYTCRCHTHIQMLLFCLPNRTYIITLSTRNALILTFHLTLYTACSPSWLERREGQLTPFRIGIIYIDNIIVTKYVCVYICIYVYIVLRIR